jgi:diguanylate cyclase (GGDEF)-like protein
VLRILSTLIIPVALLILAILLYPKVEQLHSSQLVLLSWLPLGIAIITLVLCLRFNRSRIFFTALTVVLSYVVVQWYMSGIGKAGANIIWPTLCLLLPLNILVYSLLKERGTFTLWGGTRFTLLLMPFIVIIGLAQFYPDDLNGLLNTQLVKQEILGVINFSQPSIIMMLLALLVLNGRMFAKPGAQNGALFIVLLTSIIMLHFKLSSSTNAVFASAVMLMLVVAVVQESWSMAYIDQLTNLPGRRALDEKMMKLGGNYSIAMVDIDHFKKFNDRHGHDAGDQVLSMVASRIKQAVSGGKAFRYGGEEFTIVFPGKDIGDTLGVLDDVRRNVSDSKFQLRKKDRRRGKTKTKNNSKNVKVTISIGVANRNDRLSTTQEVIKSADKALYRAKKQGRNRVCK